MASVNTDGEIKYPNSKIALEEMHIAYEVENERKRTLDGKASAFMAANFAVLTIYIPLIPFDRMLDFFSKAGGYKIAVAALTLAVLVVGIIFSMIAFKWLADGYSNKQYRFLNVDELLRLANAGENYSDGTAENGMVAHYHYILRGTIDELGNMKINEDRAARIQKGINATVIGLKVVPALKEKTKQLMKEKAFTDYFESAIQRLLDEGDLQIKAIPTDGAFGAEIDFWRIMRKRRHGCRKV